MSCWRVMQLGAWGGGSVSGRCVPSDTSRLAAGAGSRVKSCSCHVAASLATGLMHVMEMIVQRGQTSRSIRCYIIACSTL